MTDNHYVYNREEQSECVACLTGKDTPCLKCGKPMRNPLTTESMRPTFGGFPYDDL